MSDDFDGLMDIEIPPDFVLEDVDDDPQFVVQGAAFAEYEVAHETEVAWWGEALTRYMDEYRFSNIADLQDLDRLLQSELLSYRWGNWLAREADYEGRAFAEDDVRKSKENLDREIRQLKSHMGMGRAKRLESEQESVAEFLTQLKRRARQFGVHRNNQIAKAIDIFMDLRSKVLMHDRTDIEEQAESKIRMQDIFDWIRDEAIPEFDAIDEAFRKDQVLWIRDIS